MTVQNYAAPRNAIDQRRTLAPLAHTVPANWVLAALSATELERLSGEVRAVILRKGDILHKEGETAQYVYFLESGLVSLLLSSQAGDSIEVGLVGCEGMVGACGLVGSGRSFSEAKVQLSGRAWRMPADVFQQEFRRGGILHQMALQHLDLLLFQAAQRALCNRLHTVEQRLCEWLLMARNCAQTNELYFTQENIAAMLGVRRSGVTIAAGDLQQAGLIQYTRGSINILNTAGLIQKACPCYHAIRRNFIQLYARSRDLREQSLRPGGSTPTLHSHARYSHPQPISAPSLAQPFWVEP